MFLNNEIQGIKVWHIVLVIVLAFACGMMAGEQVWTAKAAKHYTEMSKVNIG